MRSRWLLPLIAGGCSGQGAEGPAWPGALCEARIEGQGAASAPAAAGAPAGPRSRVLVDVRVGVKEGLAELEKALPRRLAEQRGVDIGDAGRLSFTIDRGPFGVRVDGDDLLVEVDLEGRAEVCKPLALLGCVGYASCAPRGRASAALRLLLGDGYRIGPSRVQIPVTKPCTLSALGIDMTGEVQGQANKQAEELRRRIDGALPEAGATVEQLWQVLSATVPLGGGACARVTPTAVVQTGPRLRGEALTVGIGVEGEVRVEAACGPARPAPPLPPPRLERGLEPSIDLRIPVVTSWADVGLAASRSLALAEPRAGAEVVHITDARARPADGGKALVGLTLAGRACGEVWFEATAAAREAGVALVGLAPAAGEAERAAKAAPRLDLGALGRWLDGKIRVPLPVDVGAMPRRIDQLAARLLSNDSQDGPLRYDVSVAMGSARVERVDVSAEGLVTLVAALGEAKVQVRPPGSSTKR